VALSPRLGAVLGLMALADAAPAAAQLDNRSFTVTTSADSARVGDTIVVHFRLLLNERDLLTDTLPRPVAELPPGIRVYRVQQLVRGTDRIFRGDALVAFFRPGKQQVPSFGVPWVQVVTGHRGIVASETAEVEIVPVLPGGNPTLRDIRELQRSPGPGPLPLVALGVALVAAAAWGLRRRLRRQTSEAPALAPAAPPAPLDPYAMALERLAALEREPLAGDAVEARYEAVADALRDYLEAAEGIPARERTTTELLWALPPRLTESGSRRLTGEVLSEADLVKFARQRPDAGAAAAHLGQARELLRRWHEAAPAAPETEADAIR
jgi:hypothetical protein